MHIDSHTHSPRMTYLICIWNEHIAEKREREEIEKILHAHQEVITLYQQYKDQLFKAETELRDVQHQIKALENGDDV
jgi:hypothetical protein